MSGGLKASGHITFTCEEANAADQTRGTNITDSDSQQPYYEYPVPDTTDGIVRIWKKGGGVTTTAMMPLPIKLHFR